MYIQTYKYAINIFLNVFVKGTVSLQERYMNFDLLFDTNSRMSSIKMTLARETKVANIFVHATLILLMYLLLAKRNKLAITAVLFDTPLRRARHRVKVAYCCRIHLSGHENVTDKTSTLILTHLTSPQIYPDGVWFLLFKARLQFMRGQLCPAVHTYDRAVVSQDMWKQFTHVCYWEIMWINA